MGYCSECGSEVTAQDKFCQECGEPVHQTKNADSSGEENSYNWSSTEIDSSRSASDVSTSHDDFDGPGKTEGALSFAFSFPTENGYGAVIKGGVLLFLSFLIVPFFTLFGYAYRMCRAAANGKSKQPPFENWGALTRDGFFFFLAYFLFIAGLGITFGITSLVSEVLGIVIYILGIYLVPAVLTTYVATGSIKETYSTSRIFDFALTGSYFKATLMYFVLSIAVGLLAGISVITIVGPLFVYAFSILAIASYWGYIYNQATRDGVVPTAPERTPRNHRAD